jgi:hypothetical protein
MANRNGNDLSQFNHVDLLFPSKYLRGADLRGKDVTVVIESIEPRHELAMAGGKKEHKPVVSLKGTEKMWVLNKTNARTVADLYGPEVTGWLGKPVTLFPAEVDAGGKTHTAIRVRDRVPRKKAAPEPTPAPDSFDSETGEVFEEAKAEPGL